jgi:hypothetical protein
MASLCKHRSRGIIDKLTQNPISRPPWVMTELLLQEEPPAWSTVIRMHLLHEWVEALQLAWAHVGDGPVSGEGHMHIMHVSVCPSERRRTSHPTFGIATRQSPTCCSIEKMARLSQKNEMFAGLELPKGFQKRAGRPGGGAERSS